MLKIQYIPYKRILNLDARQRTDMILGLVRDDRLLIIEGRLKSTDEATLIRETMNNIDDEFSGIEIGVMHDNESLDRWTRIRSSIARFLVGDRTGLTIIGPAKIIESLKQDPEMIEIYFQKSYLERHAGIKDKHKSGRNHKKNPAKN
jgi:hypothetical protein